MDEKWIFNRIKAIIKQEKSLNRIEIQNLFDDIYDNFGPLFLNLKM